MSRPKHVRRDRAFWTKVVEDFERLGQSQTTFCARRGLELGTFRHWLYTLRREQRDGPGAAQFVPLVATTTTTSGAPRTVPFRVHSTNVELEFAELPPAEYVAELLRLLGQ